MVLTLQWESLTDIFEEFQPLFDAHYLEIYGKDITVEKEMFEALELAGALLTLTARDNIEPVGYYIMALSPSIYKPEFIEAKDIGIYVDPSHRRNGITTSMQETMDNQLIEMGVSSTLVSYPKESSIPINQGYKIKEILYERML